MADAGCRLVQKGARSERERCQEPEMRVLREGVGVLPTVRGGRDKRGQAHHRFMINNRSCTAGSVLVCGEPAEAPLAGPERQRTSLRVRYTLGLGSADHGRGASRRLHWAVQVGDRLPEAQPGSSVGPGFAPWLQSSASWPHQTQQVEQGEPGPALAEPGPW